MLKTWLRRWLGLGSQETTRKEPEEPLALRVAALEERQDFMEGAVVRLRGRITGGLRATDATDHGNGSPVEAGETPAAGAPSRGNPVALALLRKRGRL